MTAMQKERITYLRGKGESYAAIAETLSVSENTVKSYCQRKKLGALYISELITTVGEACDNCGHPLERKQGAKRKRFCSDKCRLLWWKANTGRLNRKAIYQFKCAGCGTPFESYGNANRRYCSHSCYVAKRFGSVSL